MTDIFQDWKNNRFVVVPHELLDHDESLIVLTDVSYWNDNFAHKLEFFVKLMNDLLSEIRK